MADWQSYSNGQLIVRKIFPEGNAVMSRVLAGCANEPDLAAFNPTPVNPPVNAIGGLAVAKDGSVIMSNMHRAKILKISPAGVVTTLAGTGVSQTSPDGISAAGSPVSTPLGTAVGPDGSIYFVEYGQKRPPEISAGSRVRKIGRDGMLSTVAGTGDDGDSGENLGAVNARLRAGSIAVGADGRLFIADIGNNKIKVVDTNGVLHTIAGGGVQSAGLQTVDALQAALQGPSSLAVTNDGTVYFVNFGSNQVMQLKARQGGGWDLAAFFGVKRAADCGTSTVKGQANEANVSAAVKSSLAVICEGVPQAVTVRDTCPGAGAQTRIAISQTVNGYANIVEVVKPCGG